MLVFSDMTSRTRFVSFGVAAAVVALPAAVLACAVCISGAEGSASADAFNWSVVFLMATPYVVVSSIGGWLYYSYRRGAGQRGGTKTDAPTVQFVWDPKESEK